MKEQTKQKEKSPEPERVSTSDLIIPDEVLDLIRFMCNTWTQIDAFVYANMTEKMIRQYPVIQGTTNQINLQQIGKQPYDSTKIPKAVDWLLST